MTSGSRLCRGCGTRFQLARLDERLCQTCNASQSELTAVDRYVKAHPGDDVNRVALATGVSEASIVRFAQAGQLSRIPSGAEPDKHCGCPPERPGSCLKCRSELASQLKSALQDSRANNRFAGSNDGQHRGMTTRRSIG
jgi:hypothetical protein